MDAPKVPDTSPALSIMPARFEIVLTDDASNPLSFLSPPLSDISEMIEIERDCFSLSHTARDSSAFDDSVQQRLFELQKKAEKFGDSPRFFNRIANLQRALGDLGAEAMSLARANELEHDDFFRRKIAENFLRAGSSEAARALFTSLGSSDSYSALRIASLFVVDGDLDEADKWVAKAVALEPDGYAERLFEGGMLLVRGHLHQAIRILWMALSERPTSSVAYANLALAYLGTHNTKKAFTCLKRSVALDPLNRSAILGLADVAFLLDRDADAINSIRYFLQFEQREPAIWSRLARSLLKLEAVDECISALKRQGAFERSISLWNNLGVAYAKKKLKQQSLEAFNYALKIDGNGRSADEFVVARNIAQLISTMGKPDLLLGVTESVVLSDQDRALSRDALLCDIYGFHISALIQMGRKDEALKLSESLLTDPALGERLASWIFQSLTGLYGLTRDSDQTLDEILDRFLDGSLPNTKNVGLMNNVAFALAELGRLDEAARCILLVGHALHKHAYLTATFGLLNFRRGRADYGESLYKEAISLAPTARDKSRIRQKMYLEIGRHLASRDSVDAKRALDRSLKEKQGDANLARQANRLLKSLKTR